MPNTAVPFRCGITYYIGKLFPRGILVRWDVHGVDLNNLCSQRPGPNRDLGKTVIVLRLGPYVHKEREETPSATRADDAGVGHRRVRQYARPC